MIQLGKYRASILSFLFDKLPVGNNVDWLEFSLSGKFSGKYFVAYSAMKFDKTANIVFTLPHYSRNVFIALTRTKLRETALVLANLEDYERESSIQLKFAEVVVMPNQTQDIINLPYAVVLLRTATSLDCTNVPDSQVIDGKKIQFFLVVPLSKDEWNICQQRGHDALMDHFQENEKELFF